MGLHQNLHFDTAPSNAPEHCIGKATGLPEGERKRGNAPWKGAVAQRLGIVTDGFFKKSVT